MRVESGVNARVQSIASRGALISLTIVCILLGSLLAGRGGRTLAQEGTPAATLATPVAIDFSQIVALRPAEVRSGPCTDPGEAVAALEPLEKPEGEAQGQGIAVEAERSYTGIPLAMDALLASETNISILLNEDDDAVTLACGEVGGVISEGGSLVLKLSEQNDSGFSGIAYLAPDDLGGTGISVFLAGELTVEETRELIAAATPAEDLEPLPEPTPTAEPVQVADLVLLEWLIDMPEEIRAGRVNFAVTNEGAEAHSLVIEGQGLSFALPAPLDPGDSTVLQADLPPGDYVVYCPVGDGAHREEGMEGTLTVVA